MRPDRPRCAPNRVRRGAWRQAASQRSPRWLRSIASCARFSREQLALAFYAPAIARKRAVGTHDAVARNRHREGITGDGLRDCAYRVRDADPLGELGVAHGATGRDLPERLPDALLKGGAAH